MEIYTIGFTQKSAAEFFSALKRAGIKRLIDVRLNNQSQLAAFTKRDDLKYFLQEICRADYVHEPLLSPTKEILDAYKNKTMSWEEYTRHFGELLDTRKIAGVLDKNLFAVSVVLLCSEPTAERCHRRLVAEYLRREWGNVDIIHL